MHQQPTTNRRRHSTVGSGKSKNGRRYCGELRYHTLHEGWHHSFGTSRRQLHNFRCADSPELQQLGRARTYLLIARSTLFGEQSTQERVPRNLVCHASRFKRLALAPTFLFRNQARSAAHWKPWRAPFTSGCHRSARFKTPILAAMASAEMAISRWLIPADSPHLPGDRTRPAPEESLVSFHEHLSLCRTASGMSSTGRVVILRLSYDSSCRYHSPSRASTS